MKIFQQSKKSISKVIKIFVCGELYISSGHLRTWLHAGGGHVLRFIDVKYIENVCYIKHYCVFLHVINYNYGKEHVWKDDAKDIE